MEQSAGDGVLVLIWCFVGWHVDESISGGYIDNWLNVDMTFEIMISSKK